MIRDRHIVWCSWLWVVVAWAMPAGAALAQTTTPPDDGSWRDVPIIMLDGTEMEGQFVRADDKVVVLKADGVNKTLKVEDIHPWNLYRNVRLFQLGLKNPRMFVEIGRYGLLPPVSEEGREWADKWFEKAVKSDKNMAALVAQVRKDPETPVDVNPDAKVEGQKWRRSTPEFEKALLELSEGWYKFVIDNVDKKCARIETDHFIVYTTWKKVDHKPLAKTCEKIYRALCKKFDIPKGENIWSPKLPIYCFWTYRDFAAFEAKARFTRPSPGVLGYCVSRFGAVFLVLNQVKRADWTLTEARREFHATLVHETTHAFNSRYLSNVRLPTWFDEGIAEFLAAEVVPNCRADRGWRQVTRLVRKYDYDASRTLENFGRFPSVDYPVCQSLVRFMMTGKYKKKFIKFYKLLKAGKSEADALEETYGWDRDELLERWFNAARGV